MRAITAGLVTLGLVALVGCNTSPSGGSGGPRATGAGGATASSAMFKIKAPALSTTLKQGDTTEVKLTIERGKDFKDDVTLKFEGDKGLKVEPAEKVVKAGDPDEVAVKVMAEKDAPVGDAKVTVTGMPKGGSTVAVDFKVKVEKSGG